MTRIEKLEAEVAKQKLEIESLKQVVDEVMIFCYNLGNLEVMKATLDEIINSKKTSEEKSTLVKEVYDNCTLLERMWMDVQVCKDKPTEEMMQELRNFIKKKEIKVFSYN